MMPTYPGTPRFGDGLRALVRRVQRIYMIDTQTQLYSSEIKVIACDYGLATLIRDNLVGFVVFKCSRLRAFNPAFFRAF
jgi:hypothetical protein